MRCLRRKLVWDRMNKEKLLFILNYIDYRLPIDIEEVLNDSIEDPQYSAVYVNNLISCYIELLTQLGEELPYSDAKSFFLFNAFEEKEYELFENKRKKESEYYIGTQY